MNRSLAPFENISKCSISHSIDSQDQTNLQPFVVLKRGCCQAGLLDCLGQAVVVLVELLGLDV